MIALAQRHWHHGRCIAARLGDGGVTDIHAGFRFNFTVACRAFGKRLRSSGKCLHTYYNFARIHQTLQVTPAMETGVTDHVWSIEKIVGLLDWAKSN